MLLLPSLLFRFTSGVLFGFFFTFLTVSVIGWILNGGWHHGGTLRGACCTLFWPWLFILRTWWPQVSVYFLLLLKAFVFLSYMTLSLEVHNLHPRHFFGLLWRSAFPVGVVISGGRWLMSTFGFLGFAFGFVDVAAVALSFAGGLLSRFGSFGSFGGLRLPSIVRCNILRETFMSWILLCTTSQNSIRPL